MRASRLLTGLSTLAFLGVLGPVPAVAIPTTPPSSPGAPVSTLAAPTDSPPGTPAPPAGSREGNRISIGVSPTRLVIGQKDIGTTQRMTVANNGDRPTRVVLEKRNYTAGPDGVLKYQEDAPYSASNWVKLAPTEFTIPAGQRQIVTADVVTPETYEPGDHQVAIVYMVPSTGSGNIKINQGIATPVYITAPGPVVDSVFLSGLHAPRFVSLGKVDIAASVTNNGTVHHDFRLPSPLTVAASGTAEPFPDFTVPRDSVRDVKTTWDPPFICVCHPTVTMTSANGGTQTASVRVIVFPWQWFAGGLAAVLLLLLIARLARRHYRNQVLQAAAALQNSDSGGDV
jgi:hypothetical protein